MNKTYYRKCTVDGVEIFYREAGSPVDPVVLLLHGWPSSSRMFEKLVTTTIHKYNRRNPYRIRAPAIFDRPRG
jgi:pimeloyl-ACP methyl ester carboxylesterase